MLALRQRKNGAPMRNSSEVSHVLVLNQIAVTSDVSVVSTNHVALSVINGGPVTPRAVKGKESDERKDSSNSPDNHQDDPDGVNIETMLIGTGRHRKIEHRSHRKGDNARYKSTGHDCLHSVSWIH
jgi:hypothetical protein